MTVMTGATHTVTPVLIGLKEDNAFGIHRAGVLRWLEQGG
jgi:hypothetical protein